MSRSGRIGFASLTMMVAGFAALASAGPVISAGGILNGASFRFSTVPGGGIAPGAIISIFGTGLASATLGAPSVPLTTTLGGTSVSIAGIPAALYFVSANQINAQVPWTVASGSLPVVVTLNGAGS